MDIPQARPIIEQQIDLMISSGLIDHAEVFLYCNYDIKNYQWLQEKLQTYTDVHFIASDALPAESEVPTLMELQGYCNATSDDFSLLYLHVKGATKTDNPCVTDWRDLMLHFNVANWKTCVNKLRQGHDTVGVNWKSTSDHPHYSGNYWWASADYIRKLPKLQLPRNCNFQSQFKSGVADHRFDAELWIGLERPNACSLHDAVINHYQQPYPDNNYQDDGKITIVIPTMWKFPQFTKFLQDIVEVDSVSEIIIINNDAHNTPAHDVLTHHKIKLYDFGKNIFVNPAWNYGVNHSKNDKVCIMNDDVIFDTRLFHRASEFLTDHRCLGMSSGIKEYGQVEVSDGMIDFQHFTGQSAYGFGCLMFVRKSLWVDIPDGLHIYYGDNWIFDTMYFRYNQNYLINNMFLYTPYATTTQFLPNRGIEISQAEQQIYQEKIANFRRGIVYKT